MCENKKFFKNLIEQLNNYKGRKCKVISKKSLKIVKFAG